MQEQKQHTTGRQEEDITHELTDEEIAAAAGKIATDAEIDDILDKIDDVLEANAEAFVQGFIQKGGQ